MSSIFKSTYRSFIRKPGINMINLGGLAISLALVMLLAVYSYSELTTDCFQKNNKRLYIFSDLSADTKSLHTPATLKELVDLNVPDVESAVRVAGTWGEPVIQVDNREPITSDMITADSDFFKLFTYEAVEGNLETALAAPMNVALSENLATKLFGNESVVGKTIRINNNQLLTVSAVYKQPKANSSIVFNSIISIATRKIVFPNKGFTEFYNLYVLLKNGANPAEASRKITALFPENDPDSKGYKTYQLNPFRSLYFSNFSTWSGNYLHAGDLRKVMILLLVAALVLIIALVNFNNISSSQRLEKIKQTGVLKVIGADRISILKNVLSEASVLFMVALFLAAIIVQLTFSPISNYTGIHFNRNLFYKPSFLIISVVSTFVLALIFSIIPAMRISSSKAVDNLKKSVSAQPSNSFIRGLMVTSQFTIAIALIAFTVLIQKQVDFGNSNLRIGDKNIIGIKLTPELSKNIEVLKKTIQANPNAGKISLTGYFPGKLGDQWSVEQQIDGQKVQLNFDTFNGDASLCSMLDLQLVQGRLFAEDLVTDAHKLVVNETFVRKHKIANPIGTKLNMAFDENAPLSEIIGVVKDFHYAPVTEPIRPLIIQNEQRPFYCLVPVNTADFKALTSFIQDVKNETNKLSPSFPVEISFLDQAIESLYQSEIQFRKKFSLFAGSAIVICCLGILAMSLFACQHRIKEIGVRKVNGANVGEVISMLNRDFVKWVVIAFFIATPIAWLVMNRWLERFAYKTPLSWWIFALAGLLALGIALLTVSWQSWKAATRNPVEALRYE